MRTSLIALLLALGSTTRAESIIYAVDVSSKLQQGFLPMFDPSLGTLEAVTYAGSVFVASAAYHFDEPAAAATYTVAAELALFVTGGPLLALFSTPEVVEADVYDPPADVGLFVTTIAIAGSLDPTGFSGVGDLINVQVVPHWSVDVPAWEQMPGAAAGSLSFTYTYGADPPASPLSAGTPGPASFVLAATAIALVSLRGRKGGTPWATS